MSEKIKVLILWGLSLLIVIVLCTGGRTSSLSLPQKILVGIGGVWGFSYVVKAIRSLFTATQSPVSFFMVIVYAPIMGFYHAVLDTVKAFVG